MKIDYAMMTLPLRLSQNLFVGGMAVLVFFSLLTVHAEEPATPRFDRYEELPEAGVGQAYAVMLYRPGQVDWLPGDRGRLTFRQQKGGRA